MKLKPKTKEIFRFICNYWIENRCSPSMRDIADGIEDVTSTCIVRHHVIKLRNAGLLEPKSKHQVSRNFIPTALQIRLDWRECKEGEKIYYS